MSDDLPRREFCLPLIDAARHGRAADVAALLADGADVNEQNPDQTRAHFERQGKEQPMFELWMTKILPHEIVRSLG